MTAKTYDNWILEKTSLDGVVKIIPSVFKDFRGEYIETYNKDFMVENNIDINFLQDDISVSKGYRVLARLPNLPENLHDQIIQKFKTLPRLLTASPEKLYEVEGIGRSRAQQLRDYFDTLLKNIGFSYINGH